MSRHALVLGGEVIGYRDFAPIGDQSKLAAGKPRQLPVVEVNSKYDPITQVCEGPVVTVEAMRVVWTYTVRAKNADELDAMRAAKFDEIEQQFQDRVQAPITFEVGGKSYDWHADDEAVKNISGVVLMILAGVPVPNPRQWTPVGSTSPVAITHDELIGLGVAIAQRKDALFVVKKQKQAEVNAKKIGSTIDAYDAAAGWV